MKIWPNRDDSDCVLMAAIDVDLGDGRTVRTSFFSHCSKISKPSIYNWIVIAL
jgi:hypothetical protein